MAERGAWRLPEARAGMQAILAMEAEGRQLGEPARAAAARRQQGEVPRASAAPIDALPCTCTHPRHHQRVQAGQQLCRRDRLALQRSQRLPAPPATMVGGTRIKGGPGEAGHAAAAAEAAIGLFSDAR